MGAGVRTRREGDGTGTRIRAGGVEEENSSKPLHQAQHASSAHEVEGSGDRSRGRGSSAHAAEGSEGRGKGGAPAAARAATAAPSWINRKHAHELARRALLLLQPLILEVGVRRNLS